MPALLIAKGGSTGLGANMHCSCVHHSIHFDQPRPTDEMEKLELCNNATTPPNRGPSFGAPSFVSCPQQGGCPSLHPASYSACVAVGLLAACLSQGLAGGARVHLVAWWSSQALPRLEGYLLIMGSGSSRQRTRPQYQPSYPPPPGVYHQQVWEAPVLVQPRTRLASPGRRCQSSRSFPDAE